MSRIALSIDVASVATHLSSYGFTDGADRDSAYTAAVPRMLGMLERTGARATFFLVADEARRFPDVVRRISDSGHEVASHSMTHTLPFATLDEESLRLELSGSKVILRELSNQPVEGFRAPGWDGGATLIDALMDAGYEYDSSGYPSFVFRLLQPSTERGNGNGNNGARVPAWRDAFGSTRLRRVIRGDKSLVLVPMCTTPVARLPYYHTIRYAVPTVVFGAIRALALARRRVWYQFHAVDFLGLEEDDLDRRIVRHPGMNVRLDEKLALAEREVRLLQSRGPVTPLQELVHAAFRAKHSSFDERLAID